jgi:hypothetical protein
MPKIFLAAGGHTDVDFTAEELFTAPRAENLSPVQWINQRFAADADASRGTPFQQIMASMGVCSPGVENPFGLRAPTLASLLEGGYSASGANTQQQTGPYGNASRALTMISVIDRIESALARDRTTDIDNFYSLVSNRVSINGDIFDQPVVHYDTPGGPELAKASRVAQNSLPPKMLFIRTSDRPRKIGAWNIGLEWTHQAMKNTTLDYVALTTSRYLQIERDDRAYRYISSLWQGDSDFNFGAVPAISSASLDPASTGGVLTHDAWVMWLARNRKVRKITHVIMTIKTYLKVEKRVGRPGTNNYDPSLARIDPQLRPANGNLMGWGNDVKFIIVDSPEEGGPIADDDIYGVDASAAISLVTDTSAIYQGIEDYAMKRTTAMRMDWAEEVFRTFGDEELRLFDILTISP